MKAFKLPKMKMFVRLRVSRQYEEVIIEISSAGDFSKIYQEFTIWAGRKNEVNWGIRRVGMPDEDLTTRMDLEAIEEMLAMTLYQWDSERSWTFVEEYGNRKKSREIPMLPDEAHENALSRIIFESVSTFRSTSSYDGSFFIAGREDRIARHEEREKEMQVIRTQERLWMAKEQLKRDARKKLREENRLKLPAQAEVVRTAPQVKIPVLCRFEKELQIGTPESARDLKDFLLREKAALIWVSNQSDELLCLPLCRIQRFEYQVRTALRVIGSLRGRALLSDEVGLGKTVESGLILKEYLTRGMVRRFLILTVPSLIEQWRVELDEKFDIRVATTIDDDFQKDPAEFWKNKTAIVASLHTAKLKQHLEVIEAQSWNMVIVDEAHYLRNRTSLAWEAVNRIPRQFLLLLTATPVQNGLEDLYHLVSLLQPGELPSPKEFRQRYYDPKKPHQPKDPEELRRMLSTVMIRNTRANAGVDLPHRRAETILFTPRAEERKFWEEWENEFRTSLAALGRSQASLWGRLLLQSAGSSPAAWMEALQKYPDRDHVKKWTNRTPLQDTWEKKARLIPPLSKVEGGVVLFTQYLKTQEALAAYLRNEKVTVHVINGKTPTEERHPITLAFHKEGGVLILTQSGTEGRNLQFSHRLVNFDLPWNPMVIEQRIGRLHRIGQKRVVEIYNLVQQGSLQEHLLNLLQEKLNLFELVVGETGIILGDRFESDDFEEEILRRWQGASDGVAQALSSLGDEIAEAKGAYEEVKRLDETIFAQDYEAL